LKVRYSGPFDLRRWLGPKPIVDGFTKPLLTSKVPLRYLDGDMPEQELNLFQFSTCGMTETQQHSDD
jgi:hypothetical protein